MKYINIQLGEQKFHLSKIGLGTGRFGTRVSPELAFDMMNEYLRCGGNIIDTARSYSEWVPNGRGISERVIGEWLKTVDRSAVNIVTKAGMNRVDSQQVIDLSQKTIFREFEESITDLAVDKIDVFLLHRDEKNRSVQEIVQTMDCLYKTGKIGAIGVANWSIDRVKEAREYATQNNLTPFSIVQTWWSLAEYTDTMWNDESTTHMDEKSYQYILRNNGEMVAMGYTSQARGFFSKAISQGLDNLDDFLKQRVVTEKNLKKLDYVSDYCKTYNVDPSYVVLGYIINNPLSGIGLISCSNMDQLKIAMDNANSNFSIENIKELDAI